MVTSANATALATVSATDFATASATGSTTSRASAIATAITPPRNILLHRVNCAKAVSVSAHLLFCKVEDFVHCFHLLSNINLSL
jgi:hypothetical protein